MGRQRVGELQEQIGEPWPLLSVAWETGRWEGEREKHFGLFLALELLPVPPVGEAARLIQPQRSAFYDA